MAKIQRLHLIIMKSKIIELNTMVHRWNKSQEWKYGSENKKN